MFELWPHVERRLRAARRIWLFLDFDGTLVPFKVRPDQVAVGLETRKILARLADHPRIRLTVVSGRLRADLRGKLRLRRVRYIGLYGLDRDAGASLPERTRRLIRRARAAAARSLRRVPGIRIEDKSLSFVVHYRNAAQKATRTARAVLHSTLCPFGAGLKRMDGSKAWEIVPAEVKGKEAAVREELSRAGKSFLPVYLGDDESDEAAFHALRRGITVQVGQAQKTNALYRLRDPREVRQFLKKLEGTLGEGRG